MSDQRTDTEISDAQLYAYWLESGAGSVAIGAARMLTNMLREPGITDRHHEADKHIPRIAGILQAHGGMSLAIAHGEARQIVFDAECAAADLDEQDAARAERKRAPQQRHPSGQNAVTVEPLSAVCMRVVSGAQQPVPAISTPYPGLNYHLLGGFRRGELIYLGARPGMGKSALATELARHVTARGTPVLVISREMSVEALGRRVVAQEGRISAASLRTGKRVDWATLARTAQRLYGYPLHLTGNAATLEDVDVAITQVPNVALVIVDYLQMLTPPRHIRDRRQQVEYLSVGLKRIALDRNVAVLVLSSLSRPPTQAKNQPPTLASLRESGALEHDADIVLLLHRKDGETETQCAVAKNRDGRVGLVNLRFVPDSVGFEELAGGRDYDAEAEARFGS